LFKKVRPIANTLAPEGSKHSYLAKQIKWKKLFSNHHLPYGGLQAIKGSMYLTYGAASGYTGLN
jgi:hypothetical protein